MHSPTDHEIIQATDDRRIHVYTWRTTQAMRKRLAALPRSAGSINEIITKAVAEYLEMNETQ